MKTLNRLLTIALGLFLISAGVAKFTTGHVFQYIEFKSGIDLFYPFVNNLTGIAEILAGAAILYRPTRLTGAVAALMPGAGDHHAAPRMGYQVLDQRAHKLAHGTGRVVLGRPRSLAGGQLRMMFPVAALSAFLNNTPVVAMFVPLVTGWARRCHFSVSLMLMPLSYASILGGACTLLGTSVRTGVTRPLLTL